MLALDTPSPAQRHTGGDEQRRNNATQANNDPCHSVPSLGGMVRKEPKNQNPKNRLFGSVFWLLMLGFLDFCVLAFAPVDPRHLGEGELEGVRTVATVALGLNGDIQLMSQG